MITYMYYYLLINKSNREWLNNEDLNHLNKYFQI